MIGDELYVWQALGVDEWHTIAAGEAEARIRKPKVIVAVVLITRNRAQAEGPMRRLAETHRERTGEPIRLGRFTIAEVVT